MVTHIPQSLSEESIVDRHAGGRHLDASRDDALRAAALELLGEIGYDRLTVDAIAAYAGAGKATIYRRWSGKAELVCDALSCQKQAIPVPDTGSLLGDLESLAQHAMKTNNTSDSQMMVGLASALPHDAELREVFRERLVGPHVAMLKEIFERAVTRGEIPVVKNIDLVVSIIPALVFHRLLILGLAPDTEFVRNVTEGIILPLVFANSKETLLREVPPSPLTN
ncbi:MAG TPA: TetR/AcrR family transcriptional regulator [Acidimicrobiales bacterium]|nr:TetR/AcrR family transcriptional regulator [Acidimicrobiales bacterium]